MITGGCVLAIDQSTQSTKALLFDEAMEVIGVAEAAHRQFYPGNGLVEHDAQEIYNCLLAVAGKALEGLDGRPLSHISLSNQRETVVFWDSETGLPLRRAIVWQDARAKEFCEGIAEHSDEVWERSGLPLSPLFSAAKLRWALDNDAAVKTAYAEKRLMLGTVDSYLLFRLTGNALCDMTNASRTQLMNIKQRCWDARLCEIFGIDAALLPGIRASDSDFGMTDLGGALENPVPVRGVVGDSQGAFYAMGCLAKGMAKASYGTGSSVMINTGDAPVLSKRLAATVGIAAGGAVSYALEGNISHSADVVSWLVSSMNMAATPAATGDIALSLPDSGGVYLVPAFTGLGAPWFAPDARGIICGLSRAATASHIVRAGLEAIAFQISDVLGVAHVEFGIAPTELRADGGASANAFLMQFQADILRAKVCVLKGKNLSALGAALLGSGKLPKAQMASEYEPQMDIGTRERLIGGWRSAVSTVLYSAGLQG